MLLVGIDWTEAEHAACLMDVAGAVRRRLRVPHSAAGLRRLRAAVAEQEPEAGAVLVALERAHGPLVEALSAAGYTVYALNPKAVGRLLRAEIAGARLLLLAGTGHVPMYERPAAFNAALLAFLAGAPVGE
jgi:pimeloyl-ACP methyl ester carboxylesterase